MQDDKLRPALVRVLEAHQGLSEQEAQALREANYLAVPPQPVAPQPVAPQPVAPQAPVMMPAVPQQPIIIQQQPMVMQQAAPPAAVPGVGALPMFMPAAPATSPNTTTDQIPALGEAPPALGALFVTERTQRGFEHDLLPEMERLLASGRSRQQVATEILAMIDVAFRQKDLLYNILIRHQSTFESDAVYRESLERLVQAWVADAVESGG
jgi:hypothetical protein